MNSRRKFMNSKIYIDCVGQGCQPYPFPGCDHYFDGPKHECSLINNNTPDCVKTCDDPNIKYEKELYFGASAYQIPNDEKQIQWEIVKNGPVVGGMYTYDDFLHYKSGEIIDFFLIWNEKRRLCLYGT